MERASGHKVGSSPYIAVEHTVGVGGAPTNLRLGGGNGGEYRKTFHGYAPSYAQIIESPTEMQITPMQIDTWNRYSILSFILFGNRTPRKRKKEREEKETLWLSCALMSRE